MTRSFWCRNSTSTTSRRRRRACPGGAIAGRISTSISCDGHGVVPMVEVARRTTASHAASHPSALARRVAEQALSIGFDDIPADVVALAKIHFLDQLGIGLIAATLPRNRPLAANASLFGTGGNSTAFGCASPLTAASAALRHGTLLQALAYDGTHTASITHAGSVVAPVALAVCEEIGGSGADLLRAFIVGWEMFVRLGLAAPGSFSKWGFQFTAVGGPFAGALTAGLLRGLDQIGRASCREGV